MANIRINPNLEAELTGRLLGSRAETHGPMERVLGEAAEEIAQRARQIGRREFYRTGGYVRGIEADTGTNEHGELVGRVVATDWKSHWAERGWGDRRGGKRARHILARAAQQVGFRVLAGQTLGAVGGMVARRAIGSRPRPAISGQQRAISGRR
jgi:hypothetical protein